MATNDFDQAARYVARHLDPQGLFHWLLGDNFRDHWEWLEWLDTQAVPYPGSADRRSDTVATFQSRAMNQPPLALVIEFMSRARRSTLLRMTQYTLQIMKDCPYQQKPRIDYAVVGAIINLTGANHSNRFRLQPTGVDGLGMVAKFKVRNLQHESATQLLSEVQAGKVARSMLVWAPLMQEGHTDDYIAAWRAEVNQEPNRDRRGDLVGLTLVFAELAKRRPLWNKGVEGMNDVRSQVVMEWEARGEKRGEQRGIAIGEQRGEQRGIAIGEERGELHRARVTLIQYLQIRYADAVTSDLISTINAQQDLARLEAWLKAAFRAESLEAFVAAMNA